MEAEDKAVSNVIKFPKPEEPPMMSESHPDWIEAKAISEALIRKYGFVDDGVLLPRPSDMEKAPAVSDESSKSSDDVTP